LGADRTNWKPQEEAVLCFVCDKEKILLIEKKRGLGKGKVNGPGGRIQPGETPLQAAIRETKEEVGVTPINPQQVSLIDFLFSDGYSLRCYVFLCNSYVGTVIETEEAKPFWCPVTEIPYNRMWADDQYWLPRILRGEKLLCRFHFDGERMLEMDIETVT